MLKTSQPQDTPPEPVFYPLITIIFSPQDPFLYSSFKGVGSKQISHQNYRFNSRGTKTQGARSIGDLYWIENRLGRAAEQDNSCAAPAISRNRVPVVKHVD